MSATGKASAAWRLSPVFVLRHAGMPFDWLEEFGARDDVVAATDAAVTGSAPARERAAGALAAEWPRLRARLRSLMSQDEVRGAILLSNPAMYDGMLASYLDRDPAKDGSSVRRAERQLYTYLQRFCAKNETVSTFGPMGYGEVTDEPGLRVVRRPARRRVVVMARWALERLARGIAGTPELAGHVPWHRSALAVTGPDGGGLASAVWDLLGQGSAGLHALGQRLGEPQAAVQRALRELLSGGLVWRGLRFPAEVVDGLEELRAALLALPALPARHEWEKTLTGFATDCREFADAGVEERRRLLAAMEERFSEVTGAEPRRGEGRIYADRLVIFEEAESPFRLHLGRDLAARIERAVGPALELSLAAGSRWQARYGAEVVRGFGEGGGRLSFPDYAERAGQGSEAATRFAAPETEVRARERDGQAIVGAPPAEAGDAEAYALPDLCLLGATPGEVSADPVVLVARVHHHLLVPGWLTTFYDDRSRLDAQVRRWLHGTALGGQTVALATSRRNKGYYRWPGRRVLITPIDHEDRDDVLPASALTVELAGEGPRLFGPDGRRMYLYPLLADLTGYPPIAALTPRLVIHPRLRVAGAGGGEVSPRFRVGEAIYQRRGWRLSLAGCARSRGPAEAFVAMRRLALDHGLPRFCFVRVAAERKPYCVDTRSPFAALMLAHLARRSSEAWAEEMVPGPDELWLRDERGRYTCELRVQFLRERHE